MSVLSTDYWFFKESKGFKCNETRLDMTLQTWLFHCFVHIRIRDPGQRLNKTPSTVFNKRPSCISQTLTYCLPCPMWWICAATLPFLAFLPWNAQTGPRRIRAGREKGNIPGTSFNKNDCAAFYTATSHGRKHALVDLCVCGIVQQQ